MQEPRRGLWLVGLVALSIFCALRTASFAASHPDRTASLILLGAFARLTRAADYPEGIPDEWYRNFAQMMAL